jgi:hypothetical protein
MSGGGGELVLSGACRGGERGSGTDGTGALVVEGGCGLFVHAESCGVFCTEGAVVLLRGGL